MKALVYDGTFLVEKEFDKKNSYEFLRNAVGGYIEHIPMESLGSIDMWCNEEGKLLGLEPTIVLKYEGKEYDFVCGSVVFTRHDGRGGTIGLKKEDIDFIEKKFREDGYSYGFLQNLNY